MSALSLTDIVTSSQIQSAPVNSIFAEIENWLNGVTASADITITGSLSCLNLTATGNTALGNGADTLTINCSSGITFTPAATWTFSAAQTVSGTWANLGSVTTIDINGGTVDGTVIGGASAAAGTFTVVTVDNLGIDGNTISASSGNVIIEGVASSEIVLNEAGANVDIRMEGDTVSNLFVLDASADKIGVGISSPVARLQVGDLNSTTIGSNVDFWVSGGNDASAFAQIGLGYCGGNTTPPTIIAYDVTDGSGATKGDVVFYLRDVTSDSAPTEVVRIVSSGTLSITGALTVSSTTTLNGNTLIGNGADTLTINCSSGITFTPAATWTFSAGQTVSGTWTNLGTVTTVDINGGTIDGAVIGGSSAAAATVTTLAVGSTSTFTGAATFNGDATFNGTTVITSLTVTSINNTPIGNTTPSTGAFTTLSATGNTSLGNGADTLTINCSSGITYTPAATWTFSAAQTVSGTWTDLGIVTTVDINGGTIDGAVIGGSSAAAGTFTNLTATGNTALGDGADTLTINCSSGITFTPAATWTFSNTQTVSGTWANLGSVTTIDINGGTVDGAVIGGSSAAAGTFTIVTVDNLSIDGNTIAASSGKVIIEGVASSEIVLNEAGANVDIRMEGDTVSNLFILDASADKIGIGTSAPIARLHIDGLNSTTIGSSVDFWVSGGNSASAFAQFGLGYSGGNSNPPTIIAYDVTDGSGATKGDMAFYLRDVTTDSAPTERFRITSAGDVYSTVWTDYGSSSTVTGFSGTPTVVVRYKKIGKIVFVSFDISGTSNATSFSFTVPVSSANTSVAFAGSCGASTDNSAARAGAAKFALPANSSTVTLTTNFSTGLWTGSGTKAASGHFWYEASA